MLQDSEIGATPSGDPFGHPHQSKYEKLISMAKEVRLAITVVAHPCDENSLRGASAAAELGVLGQVQQSVACNALHSLETRLCSRLLQTHDCIGGEAMPLTQEFLGQMLGVRRTTVTIAARLLQNAGLIRYHRGHIQILDRAAVEDISCECYAVLRQNADQVFSGAISSRARRGDRIICFLLRRVRTRLGHKAD